MEKVNQTLGESLTFCLALDSALVSLCYLLQRGKRPLSPVRGILTPNLVWHTLAALPVCAQWRPPAVSVGLERESEARLLPS